MAGGTLTAEGILKPGTGPAGKETITVGLQSNEVAAELTEERNPMKPIASIASSLLDCGATVPASRDVTPTAVTCDGSCEFPPDSRVRGEVTS